MKQKPIYSWKRAPFIRLLLPFLAGIIVQFKLNIAIDILWAVIIFSSAGLCLFPYLKLRSQYKWYWTCGILVQFTCFSIGSLLLHFRDISKNSIFIGQHYNGNGHLLVQLEEPLCEKPNSFKAVASVKWIADSVKTKWVNGNIIIYFQKSKFIQQLAYGSRIIISKKLQPIRNTGNPGAFDYESYCHFQDIFYQVYLDSSSFCILKENHGIWLRKLLYRSREKVVDIIRKNIRGDKEAGLAEALLIGYKDDLDKSLVQSYSNTGVAHVVAISGLHLGLIYWLLSLVLKPLDQKKSLKWLQILLFISGLWLFSLLAGAGPSVIRSAVMFTFIVIGKGFAKKSVVLNSLAASAFLLLCYNPYWIWDIGFQLSYLAVWSLVVFMQPIYQLLILQNKILDFIWQMNAVTISAQLLTLPVSIYYFHQFPNLFLVTNMIAVPLSGIIVVGEIFLCCFSQFPFFSMLMGTLLEYLIKWMNGFVIHMDKLPFAVWTGLLINFSQLLLLYCFILFCSGVFLYKMKRCFIPGLLCLLVFACIGMWNNWKAQQQVLFIVYNSGRYTAIDLIRSRKASFLSDPALPGNKNMMDFQLKPSRTLFRIQKLESIDDSYCNKLVNFGNKKIVFADGKNISMENQVIDFLILVSNSSLNPDDFLKNNVCKQVVADASLSGKRIINWNEACLERNISFHSVTEMGAFVLKIK